MLHYSDNGPKVLQIDHNFTLFRATIRLNKICIMIEKSELNGVLKSTISLSGCDITVKVSKSKVTLAGRVRSTEQKGEAERIAWTVIGVWTVTNELEIAQACMCALDPPSP